MQSFARLFLPNGLSVVLGENASSFSFRLSLFSISGCSSAPKCNKHSLIYLQEQTSCIRLHFANIFSLHIFKTSWHLNLTICGKQEVFGVIKNKSIKQKSDCVNTEWTVHWLTAGLCKHFPEMWNWGSQSLFWIKVEPVLFSGILNCFAFSSIPNKGKGIGVLPNKGCFCSWLHQKSEDFSGRFLASSEGAGWQTCHALTFISAQQKCSKQTSRSSVGAHCIQQVMQIV